MPKIKPYMNKIPMFYRKQGIDIMLFAHVTALCKFGMQINEAVEDFRETYGLNEDNYPLGSALVTYSQMKAAFLWKEIKDSKI